MTRAEHLAWCKQRALEYLDAGDVGNAISSMLSDLTKWDGGQLYDADTFRLLAMDAILFRTAPDQVRNWIEGFN